MDIGGTCSFELNPNHNPAQSFINELAPFPNTDIMDLHKEESPTVTGIEATDVGSLLEQFEEASQGLGDSGSMFFTSTGVSNNTTEQKKLTEVKPASKTVTEINKQYPNLETDAATGNITLSEDFLKKVRAKIKRKSAILLPMGTPAKHGRGSATGIPAHKQPTKLQRIMMNKSHSDGNLVSLVKFTPEPDSSSNMSTASEGAKPRKKAGPPNVIEKFEVSNDYFDVIMDHDYCSNSYKPPDTLDAAKNSRNKFVDKYAEEDILDLDDGEVMDDLDCDKENQDDSRDSGIQDSFPPSTEKHKQSRSKRSYRGKRDDSPDRSDDEKYFDKIPSYYTALSLSAKPPKKNSVKNLAQNRFTMRDLIDRDPSPTRDSSLYSKIPAYHSCFTNSTKYDSKVSNGDDLFIDLTDKGSSGYSSRSHTPALIIESRHCSRSRSWSRSRSRSRSLSGSRENGSKSRERKIRGRRSRRRRRSYSSSSRSRSRSSDYSRSRSRSSSYSSYSSRSGSRSRSGSPKIRSSSEERRREERRKKREEEKSIQIEERRIVYVGKIPENYTRGQLRRRFHRFGEIEEVGVHFREKGDNYGFVTFAYTCDAYAAVEKGNDIPGELHFDLCFGGRRQFCDTEYADLDGNMEIQEEFDTLPLSEEVVDFDELLKQAVKQASSKS